MSLIHPLISSNIDVIGDVHGEIGALCSLLSRLGYDGNGNHPDNRKLVFVGDLVDRGPDSIAVFELVKHLYDQDNAQIVLGNHELNLLIPDPVKPSRPKYKHGNHWFHGKTENMLKKTTTIQFQRLATKADQLRIQQFLKELPLGLENQDIRVVHACWDPNSVEILRNDKRSLLEIYNHYQDILEKGDYHSKQERALKEQNDNPVKVLSSGKEKGLGEGEKPFEAGGRIRTIKRAQWWTEYDEEPFVVFGHYWRKLPPEVDHQERKLEVKDLDPDDKSGIPPLFDKDQPYSLLGPKQNCMCIDYSVGKRFWERHRGFPLGSTGTALAALRFFKSKENGLLSLSLLFDTGRKKDLTKK